MFGLSFGHIVLFGIIVLVFVGPEQLPEVARNLARLINELRRTTRDFQSQFTGDLNLRQPWDQPLPKPPTSVAHAPPEPAVTIAPADAHAATAKPTPTADLGVPPVEIPDEKKKS